MKLLELARGHLVVELEGKTATLYCEAFLRGHGSPDFVIFGNTISRWNPPYASEEIPVDGKSKIIQFLREEFTRRKMTFEIE